MLALGARGPLAASPAAIPRPARCPAPPVALLLPLLVPRGLLLRLLLSLRGGACAVSAPGTGWQFPLLRHKLSLLGTPALRRCAPPTFHLSRILRLGRGRGGQQLPQLLHLTVQHPEVASGKGLQILPRVLIPHLGRTVLHAARKLEAAFYGIQGAWEVLHDFREDPQCVPDLHVLRRPQARSQGLHQLLVQGARDLREIVTSHVRGVRLTRGPRVKHPQRLLQEDPQPGGLVLRAAEHHLGEEGHHLAQVCQSVEARSAQLVHDLDELGAVQGLARRE